MARFSAVKALSFLWAGSIIGSACAFLLQVIVARTWGPLDYGKFASSLTLVMLIAPLAGFGIQGFWLRAFGEEGWNAQRWIHSSLVFVCWSTFLSVGILVLWALFGPHDLLTQKLLILLMPFMLGTAVIELMTAKLLLEERHLQLALWQLVPHIMRFVLVAIVTLFHNVLNSVHWVAGVYLFVAIATVAIGATQIIKISTKEFLLVGHGPLVTNLHAEMPKKVNHWHVARETWPFGFAGILYLIYFQSSIVFLKYFDGDYSAGVYNVAFTVMAAAYLFPSVVYQKFLLPKLHRWAHHDIKKFRQAYDQGNLMMAGLGVATSMFLWLIGPALMRLIFGDKYEQSIAIVMLLAWCVPLRFLSTSVGSMLVTKNNMRIKVVLMSFVALTNVSANALLIPLFGIKGAAYSTVICEVMLLTLYFFAVQKYVFAKNEKLKVSL